MTGSRAATRYAKAGLEFAGEKGAQESVYADMGKINAFLEEYKDLKVAIQSPVIKSEDKRAMLNEVFPGLDQVSQDLIRLLVENKRIEILQGVAQKYCALYEESRNLQEAVVTTAVALTPELETRILGKVMELTGKKASLKQVVDPAIVGGFILRVGDLQYDASIANRLNALKREFVQNVQIA